MAVAFKALGVAVKPSGTAYDVTVDLVRVENGTTALLRRVVLHAADRPDLLQQCAAAVADAKQLEVSAGLSLQVAGKVLAQTS